MLPSSVDPLESHGVPRTPVVPVPEDAGDLRVQVVVVNVNAAVGCDSGGVPE